MEQAVNRNMVLAFVLITVIVLMLTGSATSILGYLQSWINADHTVSGLVLVIGAFITIIGTKILWR